MKIIFYYIRLITILIKNFGSNIDFLIDDSGSNQTTDITFIRNSLHLMVFFNFNIVILHGPVVTRIYDEEDVDNFIKNFTPSLCGTDLISNLNKISKKSILLCYSDFYLSELEFSKLDKFRKRLLISQSAYRGASSIDSQITFI